MILAASASITRQCTCGKHLLYSCCSHLRVCSNSLARGNSEGSKSTSIDIFMAIDLYATSNGLGARLSQRRLSMFLDQRASISTDGG